jgi:hypothetical protein
VPNLGLESHGGALEGVGIGYLDIDLVLATGVGGIGRRGERAEEMGQAHAVNRSGVDTRVVSIGLDVGQFLGQAAVPTAGHGG